eukprot:60365-Amphidinium_carterae.1
MDSRLGRLTPTVGHRFPTVWVARLCRRLLLGKPHARHGAASVINGDETFALQYFQPAIQVQ